METQDETRKRRGEIKIGKKTNIRQRKRITKSIKQNKTKYHRKGKK